MTKETELYIKNQIRQHLANIYKIDNLNHVSETEVNKILKTKKQSVTHLKWTSYIQVKHTLHL